MSKLWEAANTVIRVKFLALRLPGGSDGKESACNAGVQVQSMGLEDPLEKGMATHSSILAWRIPWTEEPGWGGGEVVTVHGVTKNQLTSEKKKV